MENIYLLMIVALAILAIGDLIVGVSNDAVNFLNSAIGSKAIPYKTILAIACIGIFIGASFSSGMMEVARKGIFIPGEFMFNEIMIIFMAVMITDILLLDFFNTLGMPTSTTVSIVFELLGAAVAIALIKIAGNDSETVADISKYINSDNAIQIIVGILLSVVIAFSVGALVQFISRLAFSFQYEKKMKYAGAIFSGLALSSITYFIFFKGLKGTPFYESIEHLINGNEIYISIGCLVLWTLFSQFYLKVIKRNVLVVVIGAGTFGLALAFAGNDLVNFIGVPMAAWHSYEAWVSSGVAADQFAMVSLAKKVPTEPLLLFAAGAIMVLTLCFSKKAKAVTETEIGLSRQSEGKEKFQPNLLSRLVVRLSTKTAQGINLILPKSTQNKINAQFAKPVHEGKNSNDKDAPAFDLIRASVNLMVAGVLIAIATTQKLPLSTTYVTFMVAMGSSLADRAWGRESAVYRVAGVFNVIGGWFFTAIIAFLASAIIAYLIYIGGPTAIAILLFVAVLLLARNYISYKKKSNATREEDSLNKAESSSVQGVIEESADNIAAVAIRAKKIYIGSMIGLSKEDLPLLKKSKKGNAKLSAEIDDLQESVFYFIKNLDDSSVVASHFYINILSYLQDMSQSLEYIGKASHKHVNNNHKKLKFNQTRELLDTQNEIESLFNNIKETFDKRAFEDIHELIQSKESLLSSINKKIEKQISRTRTEESSPKNTSLYFNLLTETKDLVVATMNLLELYHQQYINAGSTEVPLPESTEENE
ncbi:inorganic phosphate transporter [Galbibacter sp.]|jgi:phosphate/sulfate permease|uniref:inorganic phosphate transporter n=1 Tax=Galbibacter sp. TaxID=2918471 RepID=UPI003A9271C6